MCTEIERLADDLECYIEELADNYEDFVKKALILMSIVLGSIAVMVVYVVKAFTNRSSYEGRGTMVSPSIDPSEHSMRLSNKRKKKMRKTSSRSSSADATCTSAQCTNGPSKSSVDEKLIKEIGFYACTENSDKQENAKCARSAGRITIPSDSIPMKLQPTSHECQRNPVSASSCCSLCCYNKDQR